MLTPRKKQILDFIKNYLKKHDFSPSLEEIKRHFRLRSISNIHQHINALRDGGYLEKQKNKKRGITTGEKETLIKIPLLGTIAAGTPIEVIQEKETIAVSKNRLPSLSNIYALRVVGNSMIDENIHDDDIVLIRHQETAENGQKVVALINKTEKYKELPINKIILGDALKVLKKIPDKSIDLILTDPPYGLNKAGIKNDYDLSVFYSSLKDSYRVLKGNSFYITFFSTKFFPKLFVNNPFEYFWNFVLYCPNGRVGSPIGYSKYMSCIVFKKGEPKMNKRNKDIFVDTPGRMIEPDEGFIDHPTPKPKTFIMEILKMFSRENDIVLDPFIGSGSTAMACKLTNRKYIGIEIDEKYYQLANKRLKKIK
jgi:SOS regulatory protein LexA